MTRYAFEYPEKVPFSDPPRYDYNVSFSYFQCNGCTDVAGEFDVAYPYPMRVRFQTNTHFDFDDCPDPGLAKDRWQRQFVEGIRMFVNGDEPGWSMMDEYERINKTLFGTDVTDVIDEKTTIGEAARIIALNSGLTAKGAEKAILRTMLMIVSGNRSDDND